MDMNKEQTVDSICKLFGKWEDIGENSIYLLMEESYKYVPDGTTFTCFSGEQKIKGKDYIDQDTRFGRIAWGFTKKDILELNQEVLDNMLFSGEEMHMKHL